LLGYHVSGFTKPKISDIKGYIHKIMAEINPMEVTKVDSWLNANNDSHLYWLGLGTDKNRKPEITFYIRACVESWDDRFVPKDFFSFFNMKVMGQ
jgi:hypothetical protein